MLPREPPTNRLLHKWVDGLASGCVCKKWYRTCSRVNTCSFSRRRAARGEYHRQSCHELFRRRALATKVLSECRCGDFRQVFVLCDSKHLLFSQACTSQCNLQARSYWQSCAVLTWNQAFRSRSADRLRNTIRRGAVTSMAALFARPLKVRETVSKVRPR
jgi:hypothetical protein